MHPCMHTCILNACIHAYTYHTCLHRYINDIKICLHSSFVYVYIKLNVRTNKHLRNIHHKYLHMNIVYVYCLMYTQIRI